MKTFHVTVQGSWTQTMEIDAENQNEAREFIAAGRGKEITDVEMILDNDIHNWDVQETK